MMTKKIEKEMKDLLVSSNINDKFSGLTPEDISIIIKTMEVALDMTEQMKRHGDDPLRSQIWICRISPVLEKLKRIFL